MKTFSHPTNNSISAVQTKTTSRQEQRMRNRRSIALKKAVAVLFVSLVTPLLASAQSNWAPGSPTSPVPIEAIVGGHESNGTPVYVCQGGWTLGLGVHPGRFRSGFSGCDFGYGGREIFSPAFNVLVSSWQTAAWGYIPSNAHPGGEERGFGASLYYCRASLPDGSLQLGKIEHGFSGCHVPYYGQERVLSYYQVLVDLTPPMPLSTVSASNGSVPFGALRGGTDVYGEPLYLCVAYYNGGRHPGKLRREYGACYISYGGSEVPVSNYTVLTPGWLWTQWDLGFPTGKEEQRNLYSCRVYIGGGIQPGKYLSDISHCNFGWNGVEQSVATGFEVLSKQIIH